MTDLEVARELRAAANYIRVHGWRQGGYGEDGSARCLVGSLGSARRATEAELEGLIDWPSLEVLAAPLPPCTCGRCGTDDTSAYEEKVINWNDTLGRTAEEVLHYLESSALALEIRALAASPEKNPAPREEGVAGA